MSVDDLEHDAPDVDALLRALADDDACVAAPPELRADVLARWDACAHAQPRAPRRWRWPSLARVAAAAAIVAVVAAWLVFGFTRGSRIAVSSGDRRVADVLPEDAMMATMVEPPLDTESLQIVRVRMPRGALRAFGVALLEPDAAAEVEVDLVVGDDGFLRSIQRVQPVSMSNQERNR